MNGATWLILLLVVLAAVLAVRSMLRGKKTGCGGNCAGCSGCSQKQDT